MLFRSAGIIAAKIHPIDMLLFMPPGLINQPLSGCCVGLKPSVNGLSIDTCSVMTLSSREKSSTAIINMATTIPESLTSLLVWNKKIAKHYKCRHVAHTKSL